MSFHSPSENAPRMHALVAEDSPLYQRLATSLLARRGFQAVVVNNGQEAVVAARDFQFDLILMDVEMPILDGCSATRRIRDQERELGIHIPIVAVTSVDDRQRVLSAGMDSYISKPLTASALDAVLCELVAAPCC